MRLKSPARLTLVVFALMLVTALLTAFQLAGNQYLNGQQLTAPKPEEYRKWEEVGNSVIPDDHNHGKAISPGIHTVYIDPVAYRHRQDKGTFPDGAVIVMEVLHIKREESESGFGYFTTGGRDLLVQVKDRRVFPRNGWAYFSFTDAQLKQGQNVAGMTDRKCGDCHLAAAEDDEVFVQYFPALAKPK